MSWLLHSMLPQISRGLLFLRTKKEIWDTVNQTYAQTHNLARISPLSQEIAHHRQGEPFRSMTDELNRKEERCEPCLILSVANAFLRYCLKHRLRRIGTLPQGSPEGGEWE